MAPSTSQELLPGVYLFPQVLTWLQQKQLLKLYSSLRSKMYIPKLRSGHSMNLAMTCLGQHWSAIDYKYYPSRVDFDHGPVEPIHESLLSLATRYSQEVFPDHPPDWDIAICNYYTPNSTLGLHRDNSESQATLDTGHPVVSFSIGASCAFQLGGLHYKDPIINVRLNSGDVLIFGGLSRLRYHGVFHIFKNERVPFGSFLRGGRVNFTLRKS